MRWADRLRTALATEAATLDSAECARANSANSADSANRSAEGAGGGLSALSALLAEAHLPENAAAVHASNPAPIPPPPTGASDLLYYLRDELHCRVSLAGDLVMIQPTHRCPPVVLEAVLAVAGEVHALVEAETSNDKQLSTPRNDRCNSGTHTLS